MFRKIFGFMESEPNFGKKDCHWWSKSSGPICTFFSFDAICKSALFSFDLLALILVSTQHPKKDEIGNRNWKGAKI